VDDKDTALKLALEALEEIALAGMSGTGQESEEAMTAWHARQAWKFIGIAARALEPIKQALAQPAPVQPVQPVQEPLTWYDGAPPFPQDQEWFIAETIYGDRVVLRSLDEGREHKGSYAFRTADQTYMKQEIVKRWMQFPDCEYLPPAAQPAHDNNESLESIAAPVQPVAWPCVIAEADFEQDTITLKMQCSDYKVGAGKHWLHTTKPAQPAHNPLWLATHPDMLTTPPAAQKAIEFGMNGEKMMFKVGVQQFTLDYEPDTQDEFNFMRDMLANAFSTFTPDVKTTTPAQPAVQEPVARIAELEETVRQLNHALREATESPTFMGEPVVAAPAARIKGFDEYGPLLEWNKHWVNFSVGTRLYTTPAAAPVPLTDEQREEIAKGWRGRNWTVGDIIDAIEAAHGITEKGQP
jgi:hypothetical protein